LEFDGSNDHIHIDESGLSLGSTYTFAVFNTTVDYGSTSGTKVPWSLSTALGNWYSHVIISSTDAFYYDPGYPYPAYFYPAVPNQHLWAYKGITGSQIMYKDGTASSGTGTNSETDALTDTADNGIGGYPSGGAAFYWPGEFQEFIVYDSDQSSNRTDIEADINTEFGM
jgi:hypothetical protein